MCNVDAIGAAPSGFCLPLFFAFIFAFALQGVKAGNVAHYKPVAPVLFPQVHLIVAPGEKFAR